VAVHPIRISYKIVAAQSSPLQAGFSASSRNFKKAVDRNRIKRLLRESYRKQKAGLIEQLAAKTDVGLQPRNATESAAETSAGLFNGLALFIIFTGKELPAYELVDDKMKQALKKLADQLR